MNQTTQQTYKSAVARPLPAWTYRNPELVRLEYESVIRPSWQFAGHINQLKEPGDYVTMDLTWDSVIVIRGKDGELRAFLNACRHRATRLLDGAGKCESRITCPYHGWSYNLRGELAGLPSSRTFPGVDKAELSLIPVEIEILLGLVFVRIVPGGPSLKEMWADYIHMLEPYRIEEMVPLGEAWVEDWNCNWKIAVDNNLENYHVPVGHPGLLRIVDTDLTGFINKYGVAGSEAEIRTEPSSVWSERLYQKFCPNLITELPEHERKTWQFFTMPPNIGLDVMPDSMDVFQILPVGPSTCRMRYPIFVRPNERRELKLTRYLCARIMKQVTLEDQFLCERVQSGLDSHGVEFGPLSGYEHCIHDFHDRIRAACPVTSLTAEPPAGRLREINDNLLKAQASS